MFFNLIEYGFSRKFPIKSPLICFIFLTFYYLFLLQPGFGYVPVYLFSCSISIISFLYHRRKIPLQEALKKLCQAEGYVFVLFFNYIFIFFVIPELKLMIVNSTILSILNFCYILIFLSILKQTIVVFATYVEDPLSDHKYKNLLLILSARISVAYLVSFMSAPFLNFKFDDIGNYILIFSYINNLIALYT